MYLRDMVLLFVVKNTFCREVFLSLEVLSFKPLPYNDKQYRTCDKTKAFTSDQDVSWQIALQM